MLNTTRVTDTTHMTDKELATLIKNNRRGFYKICKRLELLPDQLDETMYVLHKEGVHYTIPKSEKAQFLNVSKFAYQCSSQKAADRHAHGAEGSDFDDSRGIYTPYFLCFMDYSDDMPKEFKKQACDVMLTCFVKEGKRGAVIHMHFISPDIKSVSAKIEEAKHAMAFLEDNPYIIKGFKVAKCTGCDKVDLSMKTCLCGAFFCNSDCRNWPAHKNACKSQRAAASSADSSATITSSLQSLALDSSETSAPMCPCGAPGLKKCNRCEVQKYCSKACQVACWPTHSFACKPPARKPPAAGT
jgi:hypothetical protein